MSSIEWNGIELSELNLWGESVKIIGKIMYLEKAIKLRKYRSDSLEQIPLAGYTCRLARV